MYEYTLCNNDKDDRKCRNERFLPTGIACMCGTIVVCISITPGGRARETFLQYCMGFANRESSPVFNVFLLYGLMAGQKCIYY